MNIKLEEAREALRHLEALEACPGWTELLLPHLQSLATHHREQCRSRSLSAEKRAEHVEASHVLDGLADFVARERARQEGKAKEAKKP